MITGIPGEDVTDLNIIQFLDELKEILEIPDESMDIELIDSWLFLKRLILGGDKRTLNTLEITELFTKTSEIVLLGMDLLHLESKNFEESAHEWYFYYDIISDFVSFSILLPMKTSSLSTAIS